MQTNRARTRSELEYELLDTGVFDGDRYFDIFVEYAKAGPEDLMIRITAINQGPDAAPLHLLPTLWFHNEWSQWIAKSNRLAAKPELRRTDAPAGAVAAVHPLLGGYALYCDGDGPLLFTDNETNHARLFPGYPNECQFVKDGIHEYVVAGNDAAVNPAQVGTKVAAHIRLNVGGGETKVIRLRLTAGAPDARAVPFGKPFDELFAERIREADEFYRSVTPPTVSDEAALVMRQALAGMLWSKQFFFFDGDNWLDEHNSNPLHSGYRHARNSEWYHMLNRDIISMPDKWEYPWYAAWDLVFHALPLAIVDLDFAKSQLGLMLKSLYQHPSGQIPAYEWNFSDVNPPVHAWATLFLHRSEQALGGEIDFEFLKGMFHKLLTNFTWWINRKDRTGKNVFEGGFLGLDNIGVFDRSAPLPTGGHLEQADGTAWMALYSQNMLELAIELASHDASYADMALKFAEHFVYIARAMNQPGREGMWDDEDGFYYDLLRFPDGTSTRLKVRSMVGLLPLCATTVIEPWQREMVPRVASELMARLERMPELRDTMHPTGPGHLGVHDRGIFALLNPERLRRVLAAMLDEEEFLSQYGIRSISKRHEQQPFVFDVHGQQHQVSYLPAESDSGMFGGNSNWRGPIWMPVNAMLIRALLNYYLYYGDSFKIECPTGSGRLMNLFEVSRELSNRLTKIFLRDESGRRPVFGGSETFQSDPLWHDNLLFYEYFHGDNGAGLGAAHQTGWTGLVAKFIQLFGSLDAERFLQGGKMSGFHAKGDVRSPA